MHKITTRLLYTLIPIFALGVFAIDVFFKVVVRYDYNLNFPFLAFSLQNLRAIIVLALILAWIFIVKRRFLISDYELSQKLWRLTVFLLANFLIAFLLELLLSDYLVSNPDLQRSTFEAVIYEFYKNVIGLLAIATLIPTFLILRELIFYKQRRTTRLYYNVLLVLIIASTLWVFYSGVPLNFSVLWAPGDDMYNSLLVWSLTIIIVFLAFRNDWITYLPRKQKFIYFGVGVVVYLAIVFLKDFVYEDYLQEYSAAVYNFANIMWFFLLIYGSLALLTLLVHLPTAKAVDRKLREVTSLYDFTRMLNTERNAQKLPQLITQLTSRVLESQSTWYLELNNPDHSKLRLMSHINLTQQQILNNPFDELTGFNQVFLQDKKPVLVNDISQNQLLRHLAQWKKDARTLIAAPLFSSRDQLLGIIYATKNQPFGFDIDDLSLLEGFANQAAMALENAELWKKSIEKERMEQELKIAREVQLKLVPQTMPDIRGVELESYFLTAYEVGGDYYDFIEFADGHSGLVIGDVSGKGTSAAFYMAEFKGVIQTLSRTFTNPRELISQANRIFYSTIERKSFVTAIVGKFLPERNTFQFVRAGHTPVLYYCGKDRTAQFLQPAGLGIGLDRGPVFDRTIREAEIELHPGDFLILFTDGLLEARNQAEEEFGEARFLELADRLNNGSAADIKHTILEEVMDFVGEHPLHDDLTFIVIKHSAMGRDGITTETPRRKKSKLGIAKSGEA